MKDKELGWSERLWRGIHRNKAATAAGFLTVASMAASPLGDTVETIAPTARFVVPGMAFAETAWIGGAAMMLAAFDIRTWNPLKIYSRFKECAETTAQGALFKAGMALNTVGAITWFVVPVAAVTTHLPVRSWGVLAFSIIDLWATVVLRHAIWRRTHNNGKQRSRQGLYKVVAGQVFGIFWRRQAGSTSEWRRRHTDQNKSES